MDKMTCPLLIKVKNCTDLTQLPTTMKILKKTDFVEKLSIFN